MERVMKVFGVCVSLALIAGCPSPPTTSQSGPVGGGNKGPVASGPNSGPTGGPAPTTQPNTPPGEAPSAGTPAPEGTPPASGEAMAATPSEPAAQPAQEGQPGDGPGAGEAGPAVDDLFQGQPPNIPHPEALQNTITISGMVKGTNDGQIRFQELDGKNAKIVHYVDLSEGKFQIEAPAEAPNPIYVSATWDGQWGAKTEPITLAGEDLVIEFNMGNHPDWATGVTPGVDTLIVPGEYGPSGAEGVSNDVGVKGELQPGTEKLEQLKPATPTPPK